MDESRGDTEHLTNGGGTLCNGRRTLPHAGEKICNGGKMLIGETSALINGGLCYGEEGLQPEGGGSNPFVSHQHVRTQMISFKRTQLHVHSTRLECEWNTCIPRVSHVGIGC